MQKTIQEIRKIITPHDSGILKVEMYPDNSMAFLIYEVEVPITVDINTHKVWFEASEYAYKLNSDMMTELTAIMKIIERNMDSITSTLKGV